MQTSYCRVFDIPNGKGTSYQLERADLMQPAHASCMQLKWSAMGSRMEYAECSRVPR
jgi:hypothetical protein